MKINVPKQVQKLISILNASGYEAYIVGGCVRDSLLGLTPKDWDMCTSATPQQMQQVFAGYHVIETGLKHGTLSVVLEHVPYEITTFRVDGEYTDHRHPDGVTFVRKLQMDLARRDFTVNAMAYHPETGLVDVFGGQEDLKLRRIRCVGEPELRFEEDALRVLRALRFASVYDFSIDPMTSKAIHALYPTMQDVAVQRIRMELSKLLCGVGAAKILRAYTDVIVDLLPQLKPSVGFEQHTAYHQYDVWEHIIRTVEAVAPNEVLRVAMLMHDSGKPGCFTLDEKGCGHAYGHQKLSRALAETMLMRLKFDNATRDQILTLVEHHDIQLSTEPRMVRRRLAQFGEETVRQMIQIHRADACGKGTVPVQEIEQWAQQMTDALEAVLAEKPCVTLKDLAVNGRDLMTAGFPKGPQIGQCLNVLLQAVVDGELKNDKEILLEQAMKMAAKA